ncbi:MAG: type II secretion system F family protein [Bacilli bacterium]|nr:type II secretion system F family protein [Bacilli bacterium]
MEKENKPKKSIFSFFSRKKNDSNSNNNGALMDMTDIKETKEVSSTSNINGTANGTNTNSSSIQSNEALEGIKTRQHTKETRPMYPFRYKAKTISGRKVTGIFEAENIDDCKRFLELQGYTDIVVNVKKKYDIDINLTSKISAGDLAFDLTQLSTYIKAGIPLAESVKILSQQATKPVQRKAYQLLLYNLLRGDSLSDAMDKQGETFPSLLVNMVRTAEMTGDLPTILDDMADYYESIESVRKEMRSAMTYPVIVIILAIGVLVFMLIYLVPQFVSLYEDQGASLPTITLVIIGMSNFLKNNYLIILGIIIAIVITFWYLYTRVKSFKSTVQVILMRIPVIGNIIIYKEVYNFTKTFASLLNHGVFITDSMEILSKITNNEIYKKIINKTMVNLAKGNTVSESFKGEWAFPEIAYQMLVTGENTGQLGLMMEKVSEHYQMLHKTSVDQLKSMIEPAMIIILAGIVGVLLLSIITPMFDIYNQIN